MSLECPCPVKNIRILAYDRRGMKHSAKHETHGCGKQNVAVLCYILWSVGARSKGAMLKTRLGTKHILWLTRLIEITSNKQCHFRHAKSATQTASLYITESDGHWKILISSNPSSIIGRGLPWDCHESVFVHFTLDVRARSWRRWLSTTRPLSTPSPFCKSRRGRKVSTWGMQLRKALVR